MEVLLNLVWLLKGQVSNIGKSAFAHIHLMHQLSWRKQIWLLLTTITSRAGYSKAGGAALEKDPETATGAEC